MKAKRMGAGRCFLLTAAVFAQGVYAANLSLETPGNQPTCIATGQNITVQLRMSNLPRPIVGYQAFLHFDNSLLLFVSGTYSLPTPFGLPIVFPITATAGGDIDVAAGINQFAGQGPTQADALLVTFVFQARLTPGATHVTFRAHDPPTQFADNTGATIQPTLIDSPTISISASPLDSDSDGWLDGCDNCPTTFNADQADSDNDGVGNACDQCPNTIPHAPVDAQGCPPFIPADFDRDGDVDGDDFATLQSCRSGPAVPHAATPICNQTDLDGDGDVDHDDFGIFQRYYSGKDNLAHPL